MLNNTKVANKLRYYATRQVQRVKRLKLNEVVLLKSGLKLTQCANT